MALVTKSFSDIITFTRASTGTYFNSAGVLTSAATNAPRFDYNPATLAAQGLLIEEQRTNLATYSAALNDPAGWSATSGLSVTANAIVAPDGTVSAERLFSNGTIVGYLDKNIAITSGVTYNFSCFFKKNNTSTVTILLYGAHFNSGGGNVIGDFNLDTGVATGINGTASMTAVGNGWYRCVLTKAATTTGATTQQSIRMASATGDVYAWGYQIEEGAFPTSYIPTTTTALTRNQDRAVVNALSPWFNATTGTIYAEFSLTQPASGANQFLARFSDNGYNNSIADNIDSGGFAALVTASGGVFDGNASTSPAVSANTVNKFAGAYAANDLAASRNGGTVATDNTATIPSGLTRFDLGSDHLGFNNIKAGYLRRITYYPRKLSSAELQAITA